MLLSKEVEVKINKINIDWYKSKGYNCELRDIITINVSDLVINSKIIVEYKCDYCGNTSSNTYQNYYKNHNKSEVKKDACRNCISIKRKESTMKKYGVDNISQLQEVKNKKEETCLENFGVKCNLKTEDTKKKIKETNMQKYGVDNAAKNDIVKQKAMNTNLERYGFEWTTQSDNMMKKSRETMQLKYGVDYPGQSPEIMEKVKKTNIEKYGVDNVLKNKDIQIKIKNIIKDKYGVDNVSQSEEIKNKKYKTFFKNQTVATSRQQRYLHNLIGGELNYANNTPNLDIAFPEEMIYVEFNGSGHNLCVKYGQISQIDFEEKEKRRYYYLKKRGWKTIIINSKYDYLPSDDIINKEIENAKKWFESDEKGHSHYIINIGNKINDEKYGKLRRITENDL